MAKKIAASPISFPVVAIGASAGGLAAFSELLATLPARSGMAFVLIQHLEPKHASALTGLLAKSTPIPVVEVSHGIPVEPDHVYVIPPDKSMTIHHGKLRLAPRSNARGSPRPIDEFSVALAEEQGVASIGVVLSGTGSDGTYGLKAIKAAGGVTFAQEPATAQWAAMPTHAITAGSVDFVLSPKQIAAELARISRHPYLADAREVPEGSDLDKVCLTVRSSTGIDFRLYKQATVRRRIARRMALQKIASLGKYLQILKHSPQEAQELADEVFIHVTSFFRDPECFQALRKRVLAKLCANPARVDPVRIWIAGCSTGEEVYSIAMLLLEELGESAARVHVQIFGTDIQEAPIERARLGVYSAAAVAGVSPARLKRFFSKADHGYQIHKFVRDLCVFARHDLAKDPPFSRLDLISCRNVLIYMGPALQKRLLTVFHYALKPGGALFLGNSESVGEHSDLFTFEDRKQRIFLRKTPTHAARPLSIDIEDLRKPSLVSPRIVAPAAFDFRRDAERVLLQYYAPPALIVDADFHIVHFQGDTSPYLAPSTGQPSFHLLRMVRPELIVDLRAAIYKARRGNLTTQTAAVTFKHDNKTAAVRMQVRVLKSPSGRRPDLLVVFQKAEPLDSTALPDRKKDAVQKTSRLERELSDAREHLHSLITEHETAREEMKAANEEVLSSNEELQSANEELETAKEELQSSNEELTTLNNELQHRNQELSVLMDDLSNLLIGVDIPVLVLDSQLRIRRFTPVAGTLLNLIPGDVGRPFSDIASSFTVIDWKSLFSELKRSGRLIQREVTDQGGHRYSLRLRPYKTSGNEIDGFLVVLFDIDDSKRALEQAQESRNLAVEARHLNDSILNSLVANVAVIDAQGIIVATNEAWNRFACDNGQLSIHSVGPTVNYLAVCTRAAEGGDIDAEIAMNGIRDVLANKKPFFQFEYPCHNGKDLRWFLMHVAPLKGMGGGAVITHTNITDRKLAEISLQTSESTIRGLLASSPQAVIAVDMNEKIVFLNGNVEKLFGYHSDELLGQSLRLLIPEASRQRHAEHQKSYFADMQSRPMGVDLPLEARRKDGTLFSVEIGLGAVSAPAGKIAVAFVSDITERKRMEQAAQAHAMEIRSLAASLLTAQEEERRRVSRELHDQICQQLASLAIDIGGLAVASAPPEETKNQLRALQARIVRASDETRHIAYELHSSVLDDLGLVASLQDLAKQFSKQTKTGVKFTHRPLPSVVPREVAACLYSVAKESLQNIAKHAAAKHVALSLTVRKGAIVLKIEDDGVGFSIAAVKGRGGLGLVGMEERVRLVKGNLSIEGQPGRGTRIALEIPCSVV